MKQIMATFFTLFLISSTCQADVKLELKNEMDKINYSIGYQIGGDFKQQGINLNSEAMIQGLRDAIDNNKALLPQEQMDAALLGLKKKIVAKQQHTEKVTAAEYRKASSDFLKENSKQIGVNVLPSGVQYKVLKPGSGIKPSLKDVVKVHYRISKVDGKEIGSTYVGGKPRTYPLTKAIPGLQEVLLMMSEGAKWQIVLPSSTAAGGREPLDDMGVMIYEMELLSVLPAKQALPVADTSEEKQKGE